MKKTKPVYDPLWTEDRAATALNEGWLLAFTFDNGKKPGYLRIYPHGSNFQSPFHAAVHVLRSAQAGSKLCAAAMQAIAASRIK